MYTNLFVKVYLCIISCRKPHALAFLASFIWIVVIARMFPRTILHQMAATSARKKSLPKLWARTLRFENDVNKNVVRAKKLKNCYDYLVLR